MSPVSDFYDNLAADYDLMTGFERRFDRERPFFQTFVERHGIRTAIDAGCGTGFHSVLLAQLGVAMTGVDISAQMITRLAVHAKNLGLKIDTIQDEFRAIPQHMQSRVDAVFCLGNTLAHVKSLEELKETFRSFASVLNEHGILFLQNLNFDRILQNKEKVQNVRESGPKTFVRFYEYEGNNVMFNIRTIDRNKSGVKEHQQRVRLFPLLRRDVVHALTEAGFTDIHEYGDIAMSDYVPETSKDLVILADCGSQETA